MKFMTEGTRVELTMVKVKAGGKTNKRTVTLEFGMMVGLTESQAMPSFLKDAWSGMRKSGSHASLIELDGEIESQNLSFYRLPKDKTADFELEGRKLEGLRLEKLGSQIFLYFRVQELLGKAIWDWIWYAFLRTVYAEFEECQTELPEPDEKGKSAAVN
ncbi:MAG: hypothetical protein WBD73_08790 [Candidatus Acidiferrales bacterium]